MSWPTRSTHCSPRQAANQSDVRGIPRGTGCREPGNKPPQSKTKWFPRRTYVQRGPCSFRVFLPTHRIGCCTCSAEKTGTLRNIVRSATAEHRRCSTRRAGATSSSRRTGLRDTRVCLGVQGLTLACAKSLFRQTLMQNEDLAELHPVSKPLHPHEKSIKQS